MFRQRAPLMLILTGIILLHPLWAESSASPSPEAATWLKEQKLTDLEGSSFSLVAPLEQGKSLVLIFWTPWCGNCAKEAPGLVKTAERFGEQATFVGVVPGSDLSIKESRVRKFIAKHGLQYPTLRDRELGLTEGLQVKGTPTIVVIDPSMKIRYHGHTPPTSWADILSLP